MKTAANLSDKGNGLYEGKAELQSGGTWQVSVMALQNGAVVASKRLSVDATGGM